MEEDIKVLEEFIDEFRKDNVIVSIKGIRREKEYQAIENLIARNKELEEIKERYLRLESDKFWDNVILKSKVREKIEELKNEIKENRSIASRTADRVEARILNDQINELYKAIKILEELLQDKE